MSYLKNWKSPSRDSMCMTQDYIDFKCKNQNRW